MEKKTASKERGDGKPEDRMGYGRGGKKNGWQEARGWDDSGMKQQRKRDDG